MDEKKQQAYARLAGFMYVFSMAVFIAHYIVLSGFSVPGDFAQTAQNIAASEFQYRFGLVVLLIGAMTIVGLAWSFFALLKPVDPQLATFGMLWRGVEAILLSVGVVIRFAILENYLGLASEADIAGRAMINQVMFSGYNTLFNISFVFLSVGSAIFFYLLYKSRFIPRLLSGFGLLSLVLFAMLGFAHLLVPDQAPALVIPSMAPMFITEVGIGLWLLIKGADFSYWNGRENERQ